jgi:hypothetical protein
MVCNSCKKECGEFYRCYKCNQSYKLQKPIVLKIDNTAINKCITCKKQCGAYKYCFECNAKKEPISMNKIEPINNFIDDNDTDYSKLNFSFIEDTD